MLSKEKYITKLLYVFILNVSEHDLTNLFCKASFQEVPKCRTLCDKTIIIFLIIYRDV